MSASATLAQVAARACLDPSSFALAHDSFIDDFYLAHPDKVRQQAQLEPPPAATGDAFVDAWLGAVGEHLAHRWRLRVPAWTRRACHNRLTGPRFVPDVDALKGVLMVTSPPAFRARLLFTVAEPLQRARFPREMVRRGLAVPWPPRARVDG